MNAKLFIKNLFIVIGYYLMLWMFDISCPIKAVVGLECPTCGVTRAMVSLVRLDFEGYLYYNPMAVFLVSVVFLFVFLEMYKSNRFVLVYGIVVLIINFISYLYRILIAFFN